MKSYKQFLSRLLARLSVAPIRILAYVLHATWLDRIYKPRFTRYAALLDLDDAVIAKLPKHSQTMSGVDIDPMNMIFVGSGKGIRQVFRRAGWSRANPASPWHLFYTGLLIIIGKSQRTGPLTPHYVNIGLQDFAFQKVAKRGRSRARHHIRIWRTGVVLPNNQSVWVAAASYDTHLVIQRTPPFINHRIEPNIDREREYIVREIERVGGTRLKYVKMTTMVKDTGSHHFTDGRAAVVEVPDVA